MYFVLQDFACRHFIKRIGQYDDDDDDDDDDASHGKNKNALKTFFVNMQYKNFIILCYKVLESHQRILEFPVSSFRSSSRRRSSYYGQWSVFGRMDRTRSELYQGQCPSY